MLRDLKILQRAAVVAIVSAAPMMLAAAEQAIITEASIDWTSAEAAATQTAAQEEAVTSAFLALPASAEPTALPVMLFGEAANLSAQGFVSQGSAYAAYYTQGDIQISISGSKSVVQAKDALTLHHEPAAWENIGTGADYSLAQFGAYYTLRITCDEPTTDTRCTQPEYLSGLAEHLFVVKGQANAM